MIFCDSLIWAKQTNKELNVNHPIWQVVCDDKETPWGQLNSTIPIPSRSGYYTKIALSSIDEIYDFIINQKNEVTVLEHHIEDNATKLYSDSRYWHDSVIVNKDIIDPLTFIIDLDIFERDIGSKAPETIVISVINKIILSLAKRKVQATIDDFIVLFSPFDIHKKKFSYHIILRKDKIMCRNQYSFLMLLSDVKGNNNLIDKMFPGLITRTYKSGKYPMNQTPDRIFDCCVDIPGTIQKSYYKDDREFFKNTLMYYHNYDNIILI